MNKTYFRQQQKFPVVRAFLQCLRPKQWSKNLLVFAALIFTSNQAAFLQVVEAFQGFVLFCAVSGCVYLLNDYIDREQDRVHPDKKTRPIASGALPPQMALSGGLVLLIAAFSYAFSCNLNFSMILGLYFFLNVAYSMKLKNIVIIDIMSIAGGFVLRALGGAVIIGVSSTPWFLLCTMLLALILAIGKRKSELDLSNSLPVRRKVLQFYSTELLNQLLGIVTSATIIFYALYTFNSGKTVYLMWTIPFVIYGVFRYLYLIHVEGKGGCPERILLEDKPIIFTIIFYVLSVMLILNII